MGMPAVAAAPAERVVGKRQLCALLEWSRSKLDRRLETDDRFPVQSRGTQAGGWKFDVEAVQAYLEPEEDRELVAEDLGTVAGREARAELTARQRRDLAQAQLHEDKLRRSRGDLVEAEPLKMALSETVTRVASTLNKMPETLVRRLNLPETVLPVLREEMDEVRRQLVMGLRDVLTDV